MAHVELSEKNPYYISKHRYYELMYELELNKLKRKALDEQAYFLELKLSMINKTTPRKNQEFMPGDLAEEF